jgi:hypothetical protein
MTWQAYLSQNFSGVRRLLLRCRRAVHLAAYVLDASTLAYGLSDSPTGMLACWMRVIQLTS